MDHVSDSVEKELERYCQGQEEFDRSLAEAKKQVESLKQKLQEARKYRADREECETIGKQINSYPSRDCSLVEIKTLNEEVSALQERYQAAVNKMQLRTKQVRLLMQCIADLEKSLQEDAKVEEDNKNDADGVSSPMDEG